MGSIIRFLLWILIIGIVLAGLVAWLFPSTLFGEVNTRSRDQRVLDWIRNAESYPGWSIEGGQRCNDAPFLLPTSGFIGYLWDDTFRPGHRHAGIDIFGGGDVGETPVYAAADGYLTRLPDWRSSLILRLPEDPFQPGRQIWIYFTHMADANGTSLIADAFPPGTVELLVPAGTLLGYQGNFSGTPGAPVGVHLHFSVVLDDGQGQFLNELDINNTLDPTPYLGIQLNAHNSSDEIPLCQSQDRGGLP